jgi:predicted amino acid dehydrogenase
MSKESVFKKIAEIGKSNVELKAEVIELGVVQDIISDYKKDIDAFTSALSIIDRVFESTNKSIANVNKIKAQAKELGIDLPKQTIDLFSKVESLNSEAKQKK